MRRICVGSRSPRAGLWIGLWLSCFTGWSALSAQETGGPGGELHRVHGVVLNGVTNRPVGGALVTSADQRMAVLCDSEGKFEFEVSVPAGGIGVTGQQGFGGLGGYSQQNAVVLMARKPGFQPLERPGTLAVSNGEALRSTLQIRLMPEAIVAGRVFAPGVEAPMGVQVQLMRRQVQDGLGAWWPAQQKQSNLRGEYRFADLQAGEYKIRTSEWMQDRTPPVAGKQTVGYPPVSYPNGASVASAAVIHLAAGQTLQADLHLAAKPYYPVEIPITNYVPGTGLQATIEGQEDGSSFSLGFNPRTHQIEGSLPNGLYHVVLTSYGKESGVATMELTVAGRAAQTGPVSLGPGIVIPVTVREEYTAAADPASKGIVGGSWIVGAPGQGRQQRSVEVYLRQEGMGFRGGAGLKNVPGDGSGNDGLVIENVLPGSYRVTVSPHRGYAATVSANGLDLLHRPLVVVAGAAMPAIEITLRDDTGTITGTVSPAAANRNDAPGLVTAIMCFPLGEQGAGRLAQGYLDQKGSFTVPNVAPGTYLVLASAPGMLQNLEYRNEETMKRFVSKGSVVTVTAGEKASVTVPMLEGEVN